LIDSFTSLVLQAFYEVGEYSDLPFPPSALQNVFDILDDLNDPYFSYRDFSGVWTVHHYEGIEQAVVTVNGVEPCGAITFTYQGNHVFNVDCFVEGV